MVGLPASDLRAIHVSARIDLIETISDLIAARRFCSALWPYGQVSDADFMAAIARYRRTHAFRQTTAMHLRNEAARAARSERLSQAA